MTVDFGEVPTAAFTFTTIQDTATFTNTSTGGTLFEWNFGEGATPATASTTDPDEVFTVVYDAAGLKTVTLVVTGGPCGNDTITQEVIIDIVSLRQPQWARGVQVYPNPNQGHFQLTVDGLQSQYLSWELVTLQGKVVRRAQRTLQGPHHEEQIRVQGLPSGVYLLRLVSDGQSVTRKVTVY